MSEAASRYARRFVIALGLLIALLGLALDYLLPNASPGLSLPQLLVVCAGFGIAASPFLWRRFGGETRGFNALKRSYWVELSIVVLTLVVLEIALRAVALPTYYPPDLQPERYEPVPWWVCDEAGCRYKYDEALAACAAGQLSYRHCIVNRQGYSDSQDFVIGEDAARRERILMLGDSFTQGFTAAIGQSFVETMERALPEAIIWNAAITGNGTHESLGAYKKLAPILDPRLTILGFYENDFRDNLLPVGGGWIMVTHPKGGMILNRYNRLDSWGHAIIQDPTLVAYYYGRGVLAPLNGFELEAGKTQLGTIALKLRDRIASTWVSNARQIELTRQYLDQLRAAVADGGGDLLALLIPSRADIAGPGENYALATEMMRELAIPYLDPRPLLDAETDYAGRLDPHWSSAGHQKIGWALSDCARVFFASGKLEDCDNIVMP